MAPPSTSKEPRDSKVVSSITVTEFDNNIPYPQSLKVPFSTLEFEESILRAALSKFLKVEFEIFGLDCQTPIGDDLPVFRWEKEELLMVKSIARSKSKTVSEEVMFLKLELEMEMFPDLREMIRENTSSTVKLLMDTVESREDHMRELDGDV